MVDQEKLFKIYGRGNGQKPHGNHCLATTKEIRAAQNGHQSCQDVTPAQIENDRKLASAKEDKKEEFIGAVIIISKEIEHFAINLDVDSLRQICFFTDEFLDDEGLFRLKAIENFLIWLEDFVLRCQKNNITPIEVLRILDPENIRRKGDVSRNTTNSLKRKLIKAKKNGN